MRTAASKLQAARNRMLALLLAATMLMFGAVAVPAGAETAPIPTDEDPDLVGLDIPDGATIEKISSDDGMIVIATYKNEDKVIPDSISIEPGQKLTVQSTDGTYRQSTTYSQTAATCNRSQSISYPMGPYVSNGRRYLKANFSYTNGSVCSSATWRGEMHGTDPVWGYVTRAKYATSTTPPGYTSTLIMNFTCQGSDWTRWQTYMRWDTSGSVITSQPLVQRGCER